MMDGVRRFLLGGLAAILVACSGTHPGATPTPGSSGISATASIGPATTIHPGTSPGTTPGATPAASGAPLAAPDLRYRLVDQLGRPLFCDPDFYPVARSDEEQLAQGQIPAIRADAATYAAIVAHLGFDPAVAPTPAQALAIYREWKMLRALVLTPIDGGFGFDYVAADAANGQAGWHVVGSIDGMGTITVQRRDPSGPPPCPICLARGTRIETPDGERRVEDLRVGMAVWTTDDRGNRVIGVLLAVGSTPVPPTHRVVHLVLADGRTVDVSPGHRLPDGRRLGDLRPGDRVDGSVVAGAALVAYGGGATFDLLPSGGTGTYWANGIRLASTLANGSEAAAP